MQERRTGRVYPLAGTSHIRLDVSKTELVEPQASTLRIRVAIEVRDFRFVVHQ